MSYIVVARRPAPNGQGNFWDAVQKLSLLFGLLAAIRSLSK